jgi:type IV pilus assembly protein PilC
VTQITWPVVEFVLSVLVIAGMLLVLGWVADMAGKGPQLDPIGLGLGPVGAIRWLGLVVGILALLAGCAWLTRRTLERRAKVDNVLLRLPVMGPTLMALALNRFCLALRLTMETGMPIIQALRMSFASTGNAAFEAAGGSISKPLIAGKDLTSVLASTRIFPRNFLDIVEVAEEGGRISEALEHQAGVYEDELRRRMTRLTQAASWGVWLVVATLIIIMIFRIFIISYLGPIQQQLGS